MVCKVGNDDLEMEGQRVSLQVLYSNISSHSKGYWDDLWEVL